MTTTSCALYFLIMAAFLSQNQSKFVLLQWEVVCLNLKDDTDGLRAVKEMVNCIRNAPKFESGAELSSSSGLPSAHVHTCRLKLVHNRCRCRLRHVMEKSIAITSHILGSSQHKSRRQHMEQGLE